MNSTDIKDVRKFFKTTLKKSELLDFTSRAAQVGAGQSVLFGKEYRGLSEDEIKQLRNQGNFAQFWSKIFVKEPVNLNRIWRCNFFGTCFIGSLKQRAVAVDDGILYDAGLYESTLYDCEIGDDALVMNAGTISRTVLDSASVVFNVDCLTSSGETAFGNGSEISVGIESGGRQVKLFAELTVDLAAAIARAHSNGKLLKEYEEFVAHYLEKAVVSRSYVGKGARLRHLPKIMDVFVGEAAVVDSAGFIRNSTILSTPEQPTMVCKGAILEDSLVQWGGRVSTGAVVSESLVTEEAGVEKHAKVHQSIIGPNSEIASGEVIASLVGPFVGMHHQSLLIAALWPAGKGNVGYGANVGSNHTSKAPDQEIWPGEGAFFGLGINVKYPTDLSRAPYSIIATGVTMLPQRVEMPFSLINTPSVSYANISPAYNEIMPGWVLSENRFMLHRNESKFRKRNKARHAPIDSTILRPDIINMAIQARNHLKAVKEEKPVYTDKEIPAIGKNILTEANRKKAIAAYDNAIRHYALAGLKEQLEAGANPGSVLNASSEDERWEHQRKIIIEECDTDNVGDLLQQLIKLQDDIAAAVERAKARDDQRGIRIIDDYQQVHAEAGNEDVVKEAWEQATVIKERIDALMNKI